MGVGLGLGWLILSLPPRLSNIPCSGTCVRVGVRVSVRVRVRVRVRARVRVIPCSGTCACAAARITGSRICTSNGAHLGEG